MNIEHVKTIKKEAEQAISQILITLEKVTGVEVAGCSIKQYEQIGTPPVIVFSLDLKI